MGQDQVNLHCWASTFTKPTLTHART